jgi:hypothetical protein
MPVAPFFRSVHLLVLLVFFLLQAGLVQAQSQQDGQHYGPGDIISQDVVLTDEAGTRTSLRALLSEHPDKPTVLFIFGGGDMGSGLPGHLWCRDSFEDTYILRTLMGKYQERGVNFIAVAAAPVYHSQRLGFPARVFLDEADDSLDYEVAADAFVESTLASLNVGILPIKPYFDFRLTLMLGRTENLLPGAGFGPVQDWHGAFRARDESQSYGVPAYWILSSEGEVLSEVFRDNRYHAAGGQVQLRYSFADIDATLETLLSP